MFSLFLLPFIFLLAMQPQNIIQLYVIIENVGRIGLWITIAYPFALLVIAWLRKKKGLRDPKRKLEQ
jgi:spore germination protein